jgi:hypothetical protein
MMNISKSNAEYLSQLEALEDIEPEPMFEVSCPNDDRVFTASESYLFVNQYRCWCGVRYEIREVTNA